MRVFVKGIRVTIEGLAVVANAARAILLEKPDHA